MIEENLGGSSREPASADAVRPNAHPAYTPGPWCVAARPGGWWVQRELSCINGLPALFTLANVSVPDEAETGYSDGALDEAGARANARLIAAAPELLEGAELLLSWVDALEAKGASHLPLPHITEPLRAAISKAEGR